MYELNNCCISIRSLSCHQLLMQILFFFHISNVWAIFPNIDGPIYKRLCLFRKSKVHNLVVLLCFYSLCDCFLKIKLPILYTYKEKSGFNGLKIKPLRI